MAICRVIFVVCCLISLMACGSSKQGYDPGPLPKFGKRQKPVPDKDTLTLKSENLKLTHFTQAWKLNTLSQAERAEKYLRLQKSFLFPIQFNGWVTLDSVSYGSANCAQSSAEEPAFALDDDHKGSVALTAGTRVQVSLEKLYLIRVEYPNQTRCQSVEVKFGVLYGTNE